MLEEYDLSTDARPSAALEIESGLIRLRHALERESSARRAGAAQRRARASSGTRARQRISLALLEAAARIKRAPRGSRGGICGSRCARPRRKACSQCSSRRRAPGTAAAGVRRRARPGQRGLAAFAASLLKRLKDLPAARCAPRISAGLSRQEHRVLSYIADGYSNKQAARALGLSESTVKFHLRSLFKKLAVRSRAALVMPPGRAASSLTDFGQNYPSVIA